VPKQYPKSALLYRWLYREDDGLVRLIGTDPALDNRALFFRWINQPGGWDDREPWASGSANTESVDNAIGTASGWPGAVPLRARPGRPPKDLADGDKTAPVQGSVRRTELYEIQRLASTAQQSVSEWVTGAIREKLARAAQDGRVT
jgi:hypothetical protein